MEITETTRKYLSKEADRVAKLLDAAERRMGEAWDKPQGVQERIGATVRKHRRTLDRLERQLQADTEVQS